MITRIEEIDDTLVICIPDDLAKSAGLHAGDAVELRLLDCKVIVEPHDKRRPTLQELVDGITPSNLHEEWNTGLPIGRELW